MSVHSFVAGCALMLMAWLSVAFMHTPVMHRGADPVTAETASVEAADTQESEELAVSVSQ